TGVAPVTPGARQRCRRHGILALPPLLPDLLATTAARHAQSPCAAQTGGGLSGVPCGGIPPPPVRPRPRAWRCLAPRPALDSLDDLHITRTAAEIASDALPNFRLCRARIAVQQCLGRENHARRTKATLHRAVLRKGFLDWMELVALGEPLDGGDLPPLRFE